ncbi:MAG: D-alanyl-D-alanine carboxypeptidase [Chloroflexi bacterium]|nr:D-alanyl-D-alanine carboxypeptidase [Chloroflexota bacterium]
MRRLISLAVLLLLGFASTGFGPPGLIESDEARTPLFEYQLGLVRKVAEGPDLIALSAAIIDGATGKMLYAKNAQARMAPASVTKIMTAVVALENARLSDYVQIKVNGYAMVGSSIMGLQPGEVLTLEDLLYGLMLPSGNDAALAIAQHVGGTEARFVQMMNEKAAALGLKDTHFMNPHGLDEDDHYSSAYDLAMLGRYAMQNPEFVKIAGTKTRVAKGKNTYALVNGNRLLGQYDGLDGVKTGFTDNAGQSYVASVTRNGRRVFVGLIKSTDRYRDATELFDYFFHSFVWVRLALPKSPFYAASAEDGSQGALDTLEDRAEPLSLWEASYVRSFVTLPGEDSSRAASGSENEGAAGTAAFFLGAQSLGEVPVLRK